jgi:hypothetical protein
MTYNLFGFGMNGDLESRERALKDSFNGCRVAVKASWATVNDRRGDHLGENIIPS